MRSNEHAKGCLRIAILSLEPETSTSWYGRILTPFAALRDRIEFFLGAVSKGANVSVDLDVIDSADLVLVQRLFPTRATWSVLESILDSKKPVVYETDDLLLNPDRTDPEYLRTRLCKPYIIDLVSAADAVTVATSALCDAFRAYASSIHVIPDFVHEPLWMNAVRGPVGPVVLGFSAASAAVQATRP